MGIEIDGENISIVGNGAIIEGGDTNGCEYRGNLNKNATSAIFHLNTVHEDHSSPLKGFLFFCKRDTNLKGHFQLSPILSLSVTRISFFFSLFNCWSKIYLTPFWVTISHKRTSWRVPEEQKTPFMTPEITPPFGRNHFKHIWVHRWPSKKCNTYKNL